MKNLTIAGSALATWVCVIAACASKTYDLPSARSMPPVEHTSIEACRASVATLSARTLGEPLHVLALSGGGLQVGAFGAGVLEGWREAQPPRPRFHIVTGVGVGALLATHALLDTRQADRRLSEIFTTLSRDDVFESVAPTTSLAETDRLERLIERHFADGVIDSVAFVARENDRLLLVGTVDLDLGTLRIWDLTALARQRDYDLYRRVLLAASSVPVAFPPVTLDGSPHVDGGARQLALLRAVSEGHAMIVGDIHVGARLQQQVDRVEVVPVRRPQ